MKKIVIKFILVSAALLFAACSNQYNGNCDADEIETHSVEPVSTPEPTPEPPPLTWQETYAALLMEYAELPPINEWTTRGFILFDIDKDGIPELIITRTAEDFFDYPDRIGTEGIYTFRNGSVVRLQGDFSTYNSAFAPSDNQPGIVVQCGLITNLMVIDGNKLVTQQTLSQPCYWDDDWRWFMNIFVDRSWRELTEQEYIELRDSFVPAWEDSELSARASTWPAEITEANIHNLVFGSELPEFIIHIEDFVHRPPVVTVQVTEELQISAVLLTG